MSIGVPYDAFWSLNPRRIDQAFVKAYKSKLEDQREVINFTAWVNGAYITKALAAVFGKSKYPQKPVAINAGTGEQKGLNMKAKMEAAMVRINARFAAQGIVAGKENSL